MPLIDHQDVGRASSRLPRPSRIHPPKTRPGNWEGRVRFLLTGNVYEGCPSWRRTYFMSKPIVFALGKSEEFSGSLVMVSSWAKTLAPAA